jgi:hypothetical protein
MTDLPPDVRAACERLAAADKILAANRDNYESLAGSVDRPYWNRLNPALAYMADCGVVKNHFLRVHGFIGEGRE